ncbi:hypothetical protein ABTZ46_20150 [Nocardioides sp. NPDC126508]
MSREWRDSVGAGWEARLDRGGPRDERGAITGAGDTEDHAL